MIYENILIKKCTIKGTSERKEASGSGEDIELWIVECGSCIFS